MTFLAARHRTAVLFVAMTIAVCASTVVSAERLRIATYNTSLYGKVAGQNGFRLSLLGFEPREDFEHLVKESRGRRISPASPVGDGSGAMSPRGRLPF